MRTLKFLLLVALITYNINDVLSKKEGVAKVVLFKGAIKVKGKKDPLKKESWVDEGDVVITEDKSFVKLLFIDKSSMNIGPNSQVKISKFPRKKAGIITLLKGQIRSKVTKDYMDMDNKEKSKLYIKTKSAAMGVRGTDFLVNYNPRNNATALITFHGAVSMAKLKEGLSSITRNSLERYISSPAAVLVQKGQFSGVNKVLARATLPTKISPAQFEVMKKNETPNYKEDEGKSVTRKRSKFKSIIPPGVNAKSFSNSDDNIEKAVEKIAGSGELKRAKIRMYEKNGSDGNSPTQEGPPEGSYNKATKEFTPKAGGYLDMDTALYIPPPEDSIFDQNTQTFIPPDGLGSIDPITGDYFNETYHLTDDGNWEKIEATTTDDEGERSPDSEGNDASSDEGPLPPPDDPLADPEVTYDDGQISNDGMALDGEVCLECEKENIEYEVIDTLNQTDQTNRTKATFKFNTQ